LEDFVAANNREWAAVFGRTGAGSSSTALISTLPAAVFHFFSTDFSLGFHSLLF
jgi:hypothetical protein